MNKFYKVLAVFLLVAGLFITSGEIAQVMAKTAKKTCWVKKTARKIKRKVKKAVKKTRRATYKAGAAVTNKIMDGAVKAKSKVTCKKAKKTWVKGHYKKGNKKHTKGHFRKVSKKKKGASSSNQSAPGSQSLPTDTPVF